MAGSFVELLTSLTRASTVVNLKRTKSNQTNLNLEEKVFPERGGGFHYAQDTKLTANRNISWYVNCYM